MDLVAVGGTSSAPAAAARISQTSNSNNFLFLERKKIRNLTLLDFNKTYRSQPKSVIKFHLFVGGNIG